jgi:hypothetical protein
LRGGGGVCIIVASIDRSRVAPPIADVVLVGRFSFALAVCAQYMYSHVSKDPEIDPSRLFMATACTPHTALQQRVK